MGKARMVIAGALLAAAVAGCSGHSAAKAAAPQSAQGQKSYQDGFKVGESISLPNETAAHMQSNCTVSARQKMPGTDLKSDWVQGCVAGIIQAEITQGDSG